MKESNNNNLFVSALLLPFTLFIFGPFELYFSNKKDFGTNLARTWWLPLVCFVVVYLAIVVVGIVLNKLTKHSWIYNTAIVSLGILVWAQGNFLSLKVGVLNGAEVNWSDFKRQYIIDTSIWLAFLVITIILVKKFFKYKEYYKYCSLFLVLTQLLTFIWLLIPNIKEDFSFEQKDCMLYDGMFDVAADDEILIFLMDMYDDAYIKELINEDNAILDNLDGFTYFNNNSSLYSSTVYSIWSLMKGERFKNQTSPREWLDEEKDDNWLMQVHNNGYNLAIYESANWLPEYVRRNCKNYARLDITVSDYVQYAKYWNILSFYKYLPDVCKPYLRYNGGELAELVGCGDYELYSDSNEKYINSFNSNGLRLSDDSKQLKFIHLKGTHFPMDVDIDGHFNDKDDIYYLDGAIGILKVFEQYLDELKKIDKYDSTTIIFMADHGLYDDGLISNPALMIKPRMAHGPLSINNAPVSNENVPATVLEAAGIAVEDGRSVWDISENEEVERIFYQYVLGEEQTGYKSRNYLVEYRADSKSNSPEKYTLTGNEITGSGDIIDHFKYCPTCRNNIEPQIVEHNNVLWYHGRDESYPAEYR